MRRKTVYILSIILLFLISGRVYGQTDPIVTTDPADDITATTATLGGNVSDTGGSNITERGVYWSTSNGFTPPGEGTEVSETGDWGIGEFSVSVTGLPPGTTIYFIAYATNDEGSNYVYGNEESFVTLPLVTTAAVTVIDGTTAVSGGNVASDGGDPVTARGVCWNTTGTPTVGDNEGITTDGTGTGSFSSYISGLNPGTTYHVRAYAAGSAGTGYGSDVAFTTDTVPTVTTASVSDIGLYTASSGGDVTDEGGSAVTVKGVCWSTSPDPTTANNRTLDGSGPGSFTSVLTGLTPGTTYHVRAYATNSAGTGYGDDADFTTSGVGLPAVTTTGVFNITLTTAESGGVVTDDGGSEVTARGVCWSTSANPTIGDEFEEDETGGIGAFTVEITGLTPGTTYHVRAYATNLSGTDYGLDRSFIAGSTTPEVTTAEVSDIGLYTASSGGEVTDDGGSEIIARGVCWSEDPYPTTTNSDGLTNNGGGDGTFTSAITGLSPGTLYHVRAYATNSNGTSYGEEDVSFTTDSTTPTVTTTGISNIALTTAESGGNVTDDGGSEVLARGVCWSTSADPTISDDFEEDETGGIGLFTIEITGLTPGIEYHVRAYATNVSGTSYGLDRSFIAGSTTPEVTTAEVSDIGLYTASSGGEVTDDGGSEIIARGVCWSEDPYPTTTNNHGLTNNGGGDGTFTSAITGLSPGTLYHVRAYATNSNGTSYGEEDVSFTTGSTIPTVTTTGISNVTLTTAESGGNVTDDGGSEVLARGVCWSTSADPTISDDFEEDEISGIGSFTIEITGLTPGIEYHVRAYATNGNGTDYGIDISFIAGSTTPEVTTAEVSDIGLYTASSGGEVTDDGGSEIIARGVCWSEDPYPTTTNNHGLTNNGPGDGTFTSTITGLSPGTFYYVRAYATNGNGTSYGEEDVGFPTGSTIPTVTTTGISNVTQTTAESGGEVTDDGGSEVTGRGVCWSTSADPTISDDFEEDEIGGKGSFTIDITGLTPGTTYHVRAYATNVNGTSYGIDRSFIAGSTTPEVTTAAVSDIGLYTASSGGEVTDDGGSEVIARGVCWSTSPYPTTTNNHGLTNNGTGLGIFTNTITGLTPGTTYHVRAYATNGNGTSYGEEDVSFTTPGTIPTVTTSGVSHPTLTTAVCGGEVTDDGGSAVTGRGVCWSTSPYPTTTNNHGLTNNGTGLGIFTSTIAGLIPGTTYHVRAYATNRNGTSYGIDISFSAGSTTPEVTTAEVSDIGMYTAASGGEVTNEGGSAVSARGVCWSTSPNPTTANNITNNGGGPGIFTSTITGLTRGTTYHVRAYAINSKGTSYGGNVSFTTGSTTPTVTTAAEVSNITLTTAESGGEVTYDGGSEVTARGVCWSTSKIPDTADPLTYPHTTDGKGTGTFTSTITGLTPGTTYHVRAYATNRNGTSYGSERGFTAGSTTPTVTTAAEVFNITLTTAESGGEVTDDGGSEVFARGVCWSTSPIPDTADPLTYTYTVDGTGTGTFTSSITGLTPGVTYHVRAYATNSAGTSYGGERTFTTPGNPVISGKITTNGGPGLPDVTLNFSNNGGSTKTLNDGSYEHSVDSGWSGTVTPEKSGYEFIPPDRSYNNVVSNRANQDYTAKPAPLKISGRVTIIGGGVLTGLPGVILTFKTDDNQTATETTDVEGNYSHPVENGWSGTVTPSKPGYTFNPPDNEYTNVSKDIPGENYEATTDDEQVVTISGRVETQYLTGVSGVILAFSNDGGHRGNALTDSVGKYSHKVKKGWSGEVTLSRDGYTFGDPKTYTDLGSDRPDENYTATLDSLEISGRITDSQGTGIAGVTLTFSDTGFSGINPTFLNSVGRVAGTGDTTTDFNGSYTLKVSPGWSGEVVLEKSRYDFWPGGHTDRTYITITSHRPNQDYTVTTTFPVISGMVTDSQGIGIPGVTLEFSQNGGTASTDVNGKYSHAVEDGWSGTGTPTKTGYGFEAQFSDDYVNVNSDRSEQDYLATANSPVISGKINSPDGPGLPGVKLEFPGSGDPDFTYTGDHGNYTHAVHAGWSGTVTLKKDGYKFEPQVYDPVNSDLVRDYTPPFIPLYISGRVTDGSGTVGIADVNLALSNGGSTTTDEKGGYVLGGITAGWSGKVTPKKSLHEFDPGDREYTDVTMTQYNQDYTAGMDNPKISGRVTELASDGASKGFGGVTLEFSGSGGTTTTETNAEGDYEHEVPFAWDGTVTPKAPGAPDGTKYLFTPTSQRYPRVVSKKSGQNFIGIASRVNLELEAFWEEEQTLIIRKPYARIVVTLKDRPVINPARYFIFRETSSTNSEERLYVFFHSYFDNPDKPGDKPDEYEYKDIEIKEGESYTYIVRAYDENWNLIGESNQDKIPK